MSGTRFGRLGFAAALAGAVAAGGIACGPDGAPDPEGAVAGRAVRAIIGGVPDGEAHPAVGALLGNALCSGTLISPHVVVTAAHCAELGPPAEFILGADWHGSPRYPVAKFFQDPDWAPDADGQGIGAHDVGIAILVGTPTVAPVAYRHDSLDGLAGSSVTFVGFGLRNALDQTSLGIKYEVTTTISEVDPDGFWIEGGMPVKNTCNGDSGGPALMTVDGADQIVGLVSAGDQYCEYESWNTRVDANTAYIDGFVAKYENGQDIPTCGDGVCDPGEYKDNCPADCPSFCGDGTCDPNETSATCRADCPVVCGDGTCEDGEDWSNCPSDCPRFPPDRCGDGICGNTESCETCPMDCGLCVGRDAVGPDVPDGGAHAAGASGGGCAAGTPRDGAPGMALVVLALAIAGCRRRRDSFG